MTRLSSGKISYRKARVGHPIEGFADLQLLESLMAVEVGFEPTEVLPPHTLSRRARSATTRLHRRRAYRER